MINNGGISMKFKRGIALLMCALMTQTQVQFQDRIAVDGISGYYVRFDTTESVMRLEDEDGNKIAEVEGYFEVMSAEDKVLRIVVKGDYEKQGALIIGDDDRTLILIYPQEFYTVFFNNRDGRKFVSMYYKGDEKDNENLRNGDHYDLQGYRIPYIGDYLSEYTKYEDKSDFPIYYAGMEYDFPDPRENSDYEMLGYESVPIVPYPYYEDMFKCNYSIGSYRDKNSGETYSFVAKEDGTPLTPSYSAIKVLSGSAGIFEYSEKNQSGETLNGVFRLQENGLIFLRMPSKVSYRCIGDRSKSVFFPVGESNVYYNIYGDRVTDLGQYMKGSADFTRSTWAEKAITDAWNKDYMPSHLGYNYWKTMSRYDFCVLAVKAVEYAEKSGHTINSENAEVSFKDVDDYYVNKAAKLGLVSGDGDGYFHPNSDITRQDAAIMLCKLAEVLGLDCNVQSVDKFADHSDIAFWAKDYIYKICGIKSAGGDGIMAGVAGNKFAPKGNYTREQAIVTIYRLLSVYDK
jgi:hypothetical protein